MLRLLWAAAFLVLATGWARADDLANRLNSLASKHAGKVAIACKHLPSGQSFYLNADEPMPTASLIKFPFLIEAYFQAHEGKIKLSDPVALRKEDMVPGSGVLTHYFSPGISFPLTDAMNLMIALSDNTASNLVLDKVGIPAVGKRMAGLGFPNTSIFAKVYKRSTTSIDMEKSKKYGLGSTTAREMVGLFEMLNADKLVDAASSKAMVATLKKCEDTAKFPRFLNGVAIAHKTGTLDDIKTDGGLIYLKGGPVALCVLTSENKDQRWLIDNEGNKFCAEVAKAVVNYFAAQHKVAPLSSNPAKSSGS
ncbi:N/A [soil metagenome]